MTKDRDSKTTERDFSNIGYYGRPITDLNREELLCAFAELLDIYKECEYINNRCKEVLGDKKYEEL